MHALDKIQVISTEYERSLDFASFTPMDLIYGKAVFLQLELGVLKSSHTEKIYLVKLLNILTD